MSDSPTPRIPKLEERLQHYHTPEGYLDTLSDRILARLPETSEQPSPPPLARYKWRIIARYIAPLVGAVALFLALSPLFRSTTPVSSLGQCSSSALAQVVTSEEEYQEYLNDAYGQLLSTIVWYDDTEEDY